jgi:hypothetical protein
MHHFDNELGFRRGNVRQRQKRFNGNRPWFYRLEINIEFRSRLGSGMVAC